MGIEVLMRKILFLFAFLLIISLFSCSKDNLGEIDEDLLVEQCILSPLDEECSVVYLNGENFDWIKIIEAKDLQDPYFLYSAGQKIDPMGTVTISMNGKSPIVRINDSQITSILVNVAQVSSSQNRLCKAEENIVQSTSDLEPDVYIKFTEEFTFPFYIKIKAYVCK